MTLVKEDNDLNHKCQSNFGLVLIVFHTNERRKLLLRLLLIHFSDIKNSKGA